MLAPRDKSVRVRLHYPNVREQYPGEYRGLNPATGGVDGNLPERDWVDDHLDGSLKSRLPKDKHELRH